jgi:hypothetical protein
VLARVHVGEVAEVILFPQVLNLISN